MRTLLCLTVLTLSVMAVADRPARTAESRAPSVVRYSPQKLEHLRQSLIAQIAVYDAAERAMRAPTEAESAQLTMPGGTSGAVVRTVAGGGRALKADGSQMSLSIATLADDGSVRVSHTGQEVHHVR